MENHFNLLKSVYINARENTAYVTNPLSDCAKKAERVSAFVFDSPLIKSHRNTAHLSEQRIRWKR